MKYILLVIIALLALSTPSSARVNELKGQTFGQAVFLSPTLLGKQPRREMDDMTMLRIGKSGMIFGGICLALGGGILINNIVINKTPHAEQVTTGWICLGIGVLDETLGIIYYKIARRNMGYATLSLNGNGATLAYNFR